MQTILRCATERRPIKSSPRPVLSRRPLVSDCRTVLSRPNAPHERRVQPIDGSWPPCVLEPFVLASNVSSVRSPAPPTGREPSVAAAHGQPLWLRRRDRHHVSARRFKAVLSASSRQLCTTQGGPLHIRASLPQAIAAPPRQCFRRRRSQGPAPSQRQQLAAARLRAPKVRPIDTSTDLRVVSWPGTALVKAKKAHWKPEVESKNEVKGELPPTAQLLKFPGSRPRFPTCAFAAPRPLAFFRCACADRSSPRSFFYFLSNAVAKTAYW